MRILWLTWKDLKNPNAGGAEVINESIASRLARDGNEVTLFVAAFPGCLPEEIVDGYKIIRSGNRFTVYWKAYLFYKENSKKLDLDLVIDEVNTIPFFARLYVKEPTVLFAYQLCREIWFHEMFFPLSLIGFLIEPVYLRILNASKVITVSNSSKIDLIKNGFSEDNIGIIPLAVDIEPVKDVETLVKYQGKTLISLGAMRSMKQTLHQVQAFEIAKKYIPDLKLKIIGNNLGNYGKKVLSYVSKSEYIQDIEILGRVDALSKRHILSKSDILMVTSVKEGWGLVVTEANLCGTIAVVYDVDGLRDSVINGRTGVISSSKDPHSLANEIVQVLSNEVTYKSMQKEAYKEGLSRSLERTYQAFLSAIFSSASRGK